MLHILMGRMDRGRIIIFSRALQPPDITFGKMMMDLHVLPKKCHEFIPEGVSSYLNSNLELPQANFQNGRFL